MAFKIFFAWQADKEPAINRWFIHDALKKAVKQLRTEYPSASPANELRMSDAPGIERSERKLVNPDQEDEGDIEIQWGANDASGATLIGETILERIELCDVYVADLTFSGLIRTADGRKKKVPNSNVMLETGAAARTGARWDRMVLVLNTAFGRVDRLPFDLRHRSCKISYELKDRTDPQKATIREQLVKDFVDQIGPMYRAASAQSAVCALKE